MSPCGGEPLIGGIYPPPFKDFISPKARRAIFWGVLGIHFGVLVCPLLWSMLISFLSPPPMTLLVPVVNLVDLPIDGPPSRTPSKLSKIPSEARNIPDPGPLSPVPEPLPEPAPEPKKDTPKPTKEPKKEPPKEVAKESTKPVKKEETKKLTAEDIRKSGQVVKNPGKKPPKGKGGPILDPNQLFKTMKDGVYQPPGGGGGPIGELGNPNEMNEYYGKVSSYLYGHWQQPSRELLGNAKPSVDVKVSIDASGRIVSASIVGRSGVLVMDSSVERLFAEVKALPVPPKAMEFTIKMMIIDE